VAAELTSREVKAATPTEPRGAGASSSRSWPARPARINLPGSGSSNAPGTGATRPDATLPDHFLADHTLFLADATLPDHTLADATRPDATLADATRPDATGAAAAPASWPGGRGPCPSRTETVESKRKAIAPADTTMSGTALPAGWERKTAPTQPRPVLIRSLNRANTSCGAGNAGQ
jgi:hypothetical protein